MKLFVVGLPIGNLEDITFRAIEILKNVDLILCEDTREFIKIASRYNITTKYESFNDYSEKEKTYKVIEFMKKNKQVAIVSDRGTPVISDPGFFLIDECLKNNIDVRSVPGASAVTTAMPLSGFGHRFLFYGFVYKFKDLKNFVDISVPLVFFVSPKKIEDFFIKLYEIFGDRKVFIAREMTKIHEEFIYSSLKILSEKISFETLGEFTVIINKKI
jgi:16S rRNA (cytidine1402-2'-O)-methyltransferase